MHMYMYAHVKDCQVRCQITATHAVQNAVINILTQQDRATLI